MVNGAFLKMIQCLWSWQMRWMLYCYTQGKSQRLKSLTLISTMIFLSAPFVLTRKDSETQNWWKPSVSEYGACVLTDSYINGQSIILSTSMNKWAKCNQKNSCIYLCVHVYVSTCILQPVLAREQLSAVSPLLLPCRSQGLNSGH